MIEYHPDQQLPDPMKNPDYWIENSLNDLFFLSNSVLTHKKKKEYKDLNWIHLKLCDFLDMEKNPILQKLIVMARDMLKSTIARAFIIQWFLKKCYYDLPGKIGIVTGKDELAEYHLLSIEKEIIKNPLIQAFFHKYIPQKKSDCEAFSREKIYYKDIEIDTGSLKNSLTGHHYEGIVYDNFCNELNTKTYEQRKNTVFFWQQQESLLAEDAWEFLFENTWEVDDVAGTILDPEGKFDFKKLHRKPGLTFISKMGYTVFSCPARDEKGEPVFPAKLNERYLQRKRSKQGPYIYSRMYDLQPIPSEELLLKAGWIQHYQELPFNFIRNIAVDCAGTKAKQSSYSGISIGDWNEVGKLHIPYAHKFKISPMELYEKIIELVDDSEEDGRPVTFIIIEREKYGIFLQSLIESKRPDLHIWTSRIKLSRPERMKSLISPYENSEILSAPGLRDYEEEVRLLHPEKEKGIDIMETIYLHFQMKMLPKKMPKSDWKPAVPDEFAEAVKRDRMALGKPFRERINSMF